MTELERERVKRGFSQKKLAELSGVDQSTISKAESGAAMGPKSAKKMALYLGVSINNLLFPEDAIDLGAHTPSRDPQLQAAS